MASNLSKLVHFLTIAVLPFKTQIELCKVLKLPPGLDVILYDVVIMTKTKAVIIAKPTD